jgi:hypothetical protein
MILREVTCRLRLEGFGIYTFPYSLALTAVSLFFVVLRSSPVFSPASNAVCLWMADLFLTVPHSRLRLGYFSHLPPFHVFTLLLDFLWDDKLICV